MSSIGAALGEKIAYLAIAKAATGSSDEKRLEALATGICQRIDSGQTKTVGPWLKSEYNLTGDTAAKVAVVAIQYRCPQDLAKIGAK